MKKNFEEARLELLRLDATDVIVTSTGNQGATTIDDPIGD